MANEQNLLPGGSHKFTLEEASRGGKKSAEVRRENKLIRDRILERMGETDWDEMIDNLIKRAKDDRQDFETLRDTIGQKPKELLQVDNTMVFTFEEDDDETET